MTSPLERQLAVNAKQFELVGRAAPAGRNAPQVARNEIVLPFIDPDQLGEMIRSIVREELEAVIARLDRPSASAAAENEPAGHDQLMTNEQVSEYLQLSEKTLRRLELDNGMPPPIWIGSSKRWRRNDLDAWLDSQKAGGA